MPNDINSPSFISAMIETYSQESYKEQLRIYLNNVISRNTIASKVIINKIKNANDLAELKEVGNTIVNILKEMEGTEGGYRNLNMNLKDVKELCKANQIKLSRVVNDKRVAYTKKELITKLKRKKLL